MGWQLFGDDIRLQHGFLKAAGLYKFGGEGNAKSGCD
jgi:hypothetical protein